MYKSMKSNTAYFAACYHTRNQWQWKSAQFIISLDGNMKDIQPEKHQLDQRISSVIHSGHSLTC